MTVLLPSSTTQNNDEIEIALQANHFSYGIYLPVYYCMVTNSDLAHGRSCYRRRRSRQKGYCIKSVGKTTTSASVFRVLHFLPGFPSTADFLRE